MLLRVAPNFLTVGFVYNVNNENRQPVDRKRKRYPWERILGCISFPTAMVPPWYVREGENGSTMEPENLLS